MLLTITWEGRHTQDLGFLLHKHPDRVQQFNLSFGRAFVFYPEVSDERTTAALLLEIDPLDLARGKPGSPGGGLFDYVNDRPYAATSFLSTAIARVFGSALNGRCKELPDLVETPLCLTARLCALRDHGNEDLTKELFEPLGYTVETIRTVLDEQFPEWGMSPYVDLTLHGTVTLSRLLNHLYVLIPVFDREKHYYASQEEIQKLLSHGEGWLADHPSRDRIVRRFFNRQRNFAGKALNALLSEENTEEDAAGETEAADEAGAADATGTVSEARTVSPAADSVAPAESPDPAAAPEGGGDAGTGAGPEAAEKPAPRVPLNTQRLEAVRAAVLASGAASVLDLGCGEGRLTDLLLNEPQIRRVTACDVSVASLERAKRRLHMDRMQPYRKDKLTLLQASLTYRDKRFDGFDCACVIEVIEHIPASRIAAMEQVVFAFAAPKTVIVTTPNREYNANYQSLPEGSLRHSDHRFEWTRAEFQAWTEHICKNYGYACEIRGIGDLDEARGTPTQMGVFTKKDG